MECASKTPRQKARELALITLYVYQLTGESISNLIDFKWFESFLDSENTEILRIDEKEKKEVFSFASEIVNGTISRIDEIDEIIKKHLVKWSFERIREVDKAILRFSIYSLIYRYDIPSEVVISEANRLATLYSEENAPFYLNGILHKVKEEFRGKIKSII